MTGGTWDAFVFFVVMFPFFPVIMIPVKEPHSKGEWTKVVLMSLECLSAWTGWNTVQRIYVVPFSIILEYMMFFFWSSSFIERSTQLKFWFPEYPEFTTIIETNIETFMVHLHHHHHHHHHHEPWHKMRHTQLHCFISSNCSLIHLPKPQSTRLETPLCLWDQPGSTDYVFWGPVLSGSQRNGELFTSFGNIFSSKFINGYQLWSEIRQGEVKTENLKLDLLTQWLIGG